MDSTRAPGFEEIVEKHLDFVYNVAYRMVGKPEDAEEVAQEAFLSAYRNWQSFRGDAEASTWLYRITVNAALMRLRRDKRSRHVSEDVDNVELSSWSPEDDPERAAVRNELRGQIEAGLDELPPDLRAAVVLRDIENLSNTEAAEVLEISIPALKARLHRGRVMLRNYLSPYLKSPR